MNIFRFYVIIGGAGAVISLLGLGVGQAALAVAVAGGVVMIAGDIVSGISYPPLVYRYRPSLVDQVTYQTSGGGRGSCMGNIGVYAMKIFHFLFNFVLITTILIIMTSLDLDKWIYYVVTGPLISLTVYIGHRIFENKKIDD